jgi:hypothetical protein
MKNDHFTIIDYIYILVSGDKTIRKEKSKKRE